MSKYGINVNLTSERMPLKQQTVIVCGGLAMWDGEQWLSMMDGSRHKPIAWSVSWWADLPNSVCPPKFCDERGWPLVPCDPAAIPNGYEAVSVGWAEVGEVASAAGRKAQLIAWKHDRQHDAPRLIIRPIPKPIRLPLAIVPNGWWVAKEKNGDVWCYSCQPQSSSVSWESGTGETYSLPPWIAAQLPAAWHDLPWDQSAVQQTEGG